MHKPSRDVTPFHFLPPPPPNQWTDSSSQIKINLIPYSGAYPTTMPNFIIPRTRQHYGPHLSALQKEKEKKERTLILVKRPVPHRLNKELVSNIKPSFSEEK